MAVIGLAPVAFNGQGADVGFDIDRAPVTDHGVARLVIHRIQPGTGVELLGRRGDQRMGEPHGVAVVLAVGLELQAVVQQQDGGRIGTIAPSASCTVTAAGAIASRSACRGIR